MEVKKMSEQPEVLQINNRYSLRKMIVDNQPTQDAFTDGPEVDCRLLKNVLLQIAETGGVNAIKYNVYGCIYPSHWKLLTNTSVVVAAGDSEFEPLRFDAWSFLKVAYASNAAGSPGQIKIFVGGKA
jgi:hypothetical protein